MWVRPLLQREAMTRRKEIETWVIETLAAASNGRVPSASIRPETLLRADLGLTSLLAVNVVLDVEEAFDIEISDEELAGFGTVGDVIETVLEKVNARSVGPQ